MHHLRIVHVVNVTVNGQTANYMPAMLEVRTGQIPLHWAAQFSNRPEVARALIEAYRLEQLGSIKDLPTSSQGICLAMQAKDACGSTPLHFAACFNKSAAVVRVLIAAFPAALLVRNRDGNLPLHLAAEFSRSDEVVLALSEYCSIRTRAPCCGLLTSVRSNLDSGSRWSQWRTRREKYCGGAAA